MPGSQLVAFAWTFLDLLDPHPAVSLTKAFRLELCDATLCPGLSDIHAGKTVLYQRVFCFAIFTALPRRRNKRRQVQNPRIVAKCEGTFVKLESQAKEDKSNNCLNSLSFGLFW